MESIIQQIVIELANNWTKIIQDVGLSDIDLTSSKLLEVSKSNALKLIEALAMEMDKSFFNAKSMRKELCLKSKERDRSREYLTKLGLLRYNRSYYKNENSGEYAYPIDEMIGIPDYGRISNSVSASLVQTAAFMSMRASAENVTDNELSGQSVCNKLRLVGLLEKELPEQCRNVSELHIFADEDHASLQNGSNKMVPLVSVTEGVKEVSRTRRKTINAVHFTSDILDTDQLWRNVGGYISKSFNADKIENIYIHGDGASWIKKGFDEISGPIFMLDGFHLQRRLKPFMTPGNSYFIHNSIREDDKVTFKKLALNVIDNCNELPKKKTLKEDLKYLLNQWDGAVNRYKYGITGSCTEAMVSHVFSERLSRDPMGWSERGLSDMASLRVFVKNGGVVSREHFKRKIEEKHTSKLAEYADEMIKSFLDFKIDNSIFEKNKTSPYGKITPISVILKSISSITGINGQRVN